MTKKKEKEKNKTYRLEQRGVNTIKIWNTVKRHNICVTGVPERKVRENRAKTICENITKKFSKETKNTKPHIHEML